MTLDPDRDDVTVSKHYKVCCTHPIESAKLKLLLKKKTIAYKSVCYQVPSTYILTTPGTLPHLPSTHLLLFEYFNTNTHYNTPAEPQ